MILDELPKSLENLYDKDSFVYEDDTTIHYNTNVNMDLVKDIKEHNFQIYNGTYRYNPEWKSPKILLIGRGITCGKVKFKVEGFLPYTYMDDDEGGYRTYLGKKVEKIIFETHPKRVADLRRRQERIGNNIPYEADILFVRRFLMDTYDFFKPTEFIEPKICIMDLETDFPVDNNKIISFAINGYDGYLYYNSKFDEDNYYNLVLDCYEKLLPYDILTNWNVEFDVGVLQLSINQLIDALSIAEDGMELKYLEYIKSISRIKRKYTLVNSKNMLDALIEYKYLCVNSNGYIKLTDKYLYSEVDLMIAPLDMLLITKKMIAREIQGRWTLDNVGKQTCGVGKFEYDYKYIRDLPEDVLREYNIKDVIIPEIIDNEYGGTDVHIILSWSLHSLIRDMTITAVVNDIALLREYHKAGIVLNSRPPYKVVVEEGYKAAEPDARPGTYEMVTAYDLHAAYPSAVVAVNASCETKDENGIYKAPNGVRFNDNDSVFITTLLNLLKERERVKKELKVLDKNSKEWRTKKFIDFALKTQVAAFSHGIFGWANSRMKDLDVADSITSVVRGILDVLKDKTDLLGYPWCYVHTDAVYVPVKSKDDIEVLGNIFNEAISDYCKNKHYKIVPRLDFQGYYPKAYIHSAARNVLVDEDGKWKPTGMNYDRSETPIPLGKIEKELISMRLNYCKEEEMLCKLCEMIDEVKTKDINELGIIKPLTKPVESYGGTRKDGSKIGTPFHITALQRAKEDYGFSVEIGEKFCVIPIMTDEVEGVRIIRRKRVFMAYPIDEGLPDIYKVDWEHYFRSYLYGKVNKLFNITPRELEKKIYKE